jgi:16S rRNA (uracil1498-N3)-methyltransferase
MTYKEALEYASKNCDVKLLPYEMAEDFSKTRELLSGIGSGKKVAIFIGPEGGFEDTEINEALSAGFDTITLGKRILRTETAGMYMMSVLSYLLEK